MKMFALASVLVVLHVSGNEDAPRPEYPQPQFQRAEWITLNGTWEFEFDDGNAGLDENWADGKRAFGRKITVPFPFEASLSGIGDTTFHPVVCTAGRSRCRGAGLGGACSCGSARSTITRPCG